MHFHAIGWKSYAYERAAMRGATHFHRGSMRTLLR